MCDMVETLEVEEQTETAKVREVIRDCKGGKRLAETLALLIV